MVTDDLPMRETYEAGMVAVGQRIAEARKEQDMSQRQLGQAVGVTGAAVQKWESGGGWEIITILQVAAALKVPPAWLLEPLIGSISPPSKNQILGQIQTLRKDLDRLARQAQGLGVGDRNGEESQPNL